MNPHSQLIRRLADKVLQQFPDFELGDASTFTETESRVEVRRRRKAYGTFSDTDKLRQVQRDLLHVLRGSDYKVKMGREDRDNFVIHVKLEATPSPDVAPADAAPKQEPASA